MMCNRFDAIKHCLEAGNPDGVRALINQGPLAEYELDALCGLLGRTGAINVALMGNDVAGALTLTKRSPLSSQELASLSAASATDRHRPLLRWLLDTHPDSLTQPNHAGSDARRVDVLLKIACLMNQPETARLLVNHYGANAGATINGIENRALGDACSVGNAELARFLLDHGASPNSLANGCFAAYELMTAAEKGHLDVVKLLVERGARINALNAYGLSPLTYARMGRFPEVIEFLLAAGAMDPWQIRGEPGPPVSYQGPPRDLCEFVPTSGLAQSYIGDVGDLGELRPDWPITLRLFHGGRATVVVTEGMSAVPLPMWEPGESQALLAELYTHVPAGTDDCPADHWPEDYPDQRWIADWLLRLARSPAETGKTLQRGSLVSNGEPPQLLGTDVPFTCWLLICYPDKPVSVFQRSDGQAIHLIHAFPLYTAERDFALEQGIAALLRRMVEATISPVIDVTRDSVV